MTLPPKGKQVPKLAITGLELTEPKIDSFDTLKDGHHELYQEIQSGNWKEETEIEKLMELKVLIQELTIPTYFATMGASNCVWVEGNLPKDKAKMIKYLDQVISSADEKELRRYRENLPHL